MGVEVEEKCKQGVLSDSLGDLESKLIECCVHVKRLIDKLDPIMTPVFEKDSNEVEDKQISTSIVTNKINYLSTVVVDLRNLIIDTTDRTEL